MTIEIEENENGIERGTAEILETLTGIVIETEDMKDQYQIDFKDKMTEIFQGEKIE